MAIQGFCPPPSPSPSHSPYYQLLERGSARLDRVKNAWYNKLLKNLPNIDKYGLFHDSFILPTQNDTMHLTSLFDLAPISKKYRIRNKKEKRRKNQQAWTLRKNPNLRVLYHYVSLYEKSVLPLHLTHDKFVLTCTISFLRKEKFCHPELLRLAQMYIMLKILLTCFWDKVWGFIGFAKVINKKLLRLAQTFSDLHTTWKDLQNYSLMNWNLEFQ